MYLLVLVSFVVEHGEGNNKEYEYSINNVNGEPKIPHRQGQVTCAIIYRMPTGLPVGNVGGKHENWNGGDGEAKNDNEFGKISLVCIVGMLVIHEKVDVEDEDENAHDYGHDH